MPSSRSTRGRPLWLTPLTDQHQIGDEAPGRPGAFSFAHRGALGILSSMARTGRPSSYDPKYVEMLDAATPAEYGAATMNQIADFLKVKYNAMREWMTAHPEFAAAVSRARAKVDEDVENAFFRTTQGFKVSVVKQRLTRDGSVVDTEEEVYIPPSTAAAQFWLRNRAPDRWKEKVEVETTVKGSFTDMVEQALREIEGRKQ